MRLVLSVMLAMSACGLVVGCEEVQRQVAVNHYVNGQILAEQGNTEAALAELALALKNNPRLDVAHATIGDIHRNRGDFEAARASYEQACKINPYAFRPHYNLGVTYQMLAAGARNVTQMEEQLFRAVSIYLRAVTLEPADFETNLNLSACYFQLGKYDLAEHAYQRLSGLAGIERVWTPDLSIVAFRFEDDDSGRRALETVNADRQTHLSPTMVDGRFVLRIAILNRRTTREHVDPAIDLIEKSLG